MLRCSRRVRRRTDWAEVRTGVEPTYQADRVHLFAGGGDPRLLSDGSIRNGPKFVDEAEPEGELRSDLSGSVWRRGGCNLTQTAPARGARCENLASGTW